jgi:hypothetical protein
VGVVRPFNNCGSLVLVSGDGNRGEVGNNNNKLKISRADDSSHNMR